MGFVMPEVVVQKLIQLGIKDLRANQAAFYDLFEQYNSDELSVDYGTAYIDSIWNWFSTTKIPVVQAWALNVQHIPCISVHLANETEDENKAAMDDFAGDFDGISGTGTGVFTALVDIGVHANKAGDHVLWLYYIVAYILFKHKPAFHRMGMKLHTFSASDYNKEAQYMGENIWTRWVRFKTTTQNFWDADQFGQVDDINIDATVIDPPADDSADNSLTEGASSGSGSSQTIGPPTTSDPDINTGIKASRVFDVDDDEDLNI